jgi:DNA-binding response OmpR family regulator
MDTKTVLMIEDDQAISSLNEMMLTLKSGGAIRSLKADTLAEGRALLDESIDLVILDLMLPDGSGLDFAAEIQAKTNAPILMLTAKSALSDKLEGLKAGGVDYITKPYSVDELCVKVVSMLNMLARRDRETAPKALVKGALILDTISGRACIAGEDLLFRPKEFALLLFLARREGQLVSAEEIYESVWRQPLAQDKRALAAAVSRLRKKLPGSGYTVISVYGSGYRFETG